MKAKAVSNLLIGGGAGLLLSTGAIAAPFTNNSGTICKNYNGSDGFYIRYATGSEVNSIKPTDTMIICPLSRDTQSTKGATAYVDIYHTKTATTSCSFWSYSYTGSLLGSFSRTWTGNGFHEFSLPLYAASDVYSDYAVACTIPGGSAGRVAGVDLAEW